jgi:hypothetical protein
MHLNQLAETRVSPSHYVEADSLGMRILTSANLAMQFLGRVIYASIYCAEDDLGVGLAVNSSNYQTYLDNTCAGKLHVIQPRGVL